MRVGTETPEGNKFYIEVTLEEIQETIRKMNIKGKLKLLKPLFSSKTKEKEDICFLNECWAAKTALLIAEKNLENKLSRITPEQGTDASKIFSQTDDRQKFEKMFSNGGLSAQVTIEKVVNLYNNFTIKGKEEFNSLMESL